MFHFWLRVPLLWYCTATFFGTLPHATDGQYIVYNGLPSGSKQSTTAAGPTVPPDSSNETPETTTAPRMTCQIRTLVTPDSNASLLIPDQIYDLSTLDRKSEVDLPAVWQPIKDYCCISVRVQSQPHPNATDIVEGVLELYCGLKSLIQFTFWVEQSTGCTDLFLENVRVDLERCGTVQPTVASSLYQILIKTSEKIVFQFGYDIEPMFTQSFATFSVDDLVHSSQPSIETMWKCNCTLPREAFVSLGMCILGSVNNITKLVVHISLIVSIGIGTTCTLILFVWTMRRVWKILEKL
uniref:Uncharacterized protein n=1 Tax=Anopheles melas TaxID=34690 RepID=A0A182TVS6_9DIPT